MNVKYHSNQKMLDQSTVMTASRITNQKEVIAVVADLAETAVAEDLADVEPADMVETTAVVADLEETDHHEKCTRQLVETVAMNVKYHLSQDKTNQSIVMTASRITNQKEDNQSFLYK